MFLVICLKLVVRLYVNGLGKCLFSSLRDHINIVYAQIRMSIWSCGFRLFKCLSELILSRNSRIRSNTLGRFFVRTYHNHYYRWTWIWRTQWDQENWSVICKIRRIHMKNTWYASDWDQAYRPSYAKSCRTVVGHIQVHLYMYIYISLA